MAIIETKVDLLMQLIDKHGSVNTKVAAKELEVSDSYIRRLSVVLQKNKLIDIKASAFSMALSAKKPLASPDDVIVADSQEALPAEQPVDSPALPAEQPVDSPELPVEVTGDDPRVVSDEPSSVEESSSSTIDSPEDSISEAPTEEEPDKKVLSD